MVAQPVSAAVTEKSLGTVGGAPLVAAWINDKGQIAAQGAFASGEYRAYLIDKGKVTDLGDFGGTYTFPIKINSKGMIIGYGYDEDFFVHGFVWYKGTLTDLGGIGGGYVFPGDINANGQITGAAVASDGQYHAFLWDGEIHDLGTAGGDWSYGVAISNAGEVAGTSVDSFATHAIVWDADGVATDVGDFGGGRAYAVAMNDAGQVLGAAADEGDSFNAFVWDNGTLTEYPGLDDGHGHTDVSPGYINSGGDFTGGVSAGDNSLCAVWIGGEMNVIDRTGFDGCYLTGINNADAVVGSMYTLAGESRAFIWQNGTTTFLTDEFSASGQGLTNNGLANGIILNEDGLFQGVTWRVS